MLILKARLTRKKKPKFIKAVTTNIDEIKTALFYKGLIEWWNEETAYCFKGFEASAILQFSGSMQNDMGIWGGFTDCTKRYSFCFHSNETII
ncbi:myb-like protein X [Vespula squamosa]|uniref:Myb-like protein X n=1 Tax=Vespula squamosa TaxID=30214 RepID=A0ABD2C224_VESSQ